MISFFFFFFGNRVTFCFPILSAGECLQGPSEAFNNRRIKTKHYDFFNFNS